MNLGSGHDRLNVQMFRRYKLVQTTFWRRRPNNRAYTPKDVISSVWRERLYGHQSFLHTRRYIGMWKIYAPTGRVEWTKRRILDRLDCCRGLSFESHFLLRVSALATLIYSSITHMTINWLCYHFLLCLISAINKLYTDVRRQQMPSLFIVENYSWHLFHGTGD